MKDAAARAQGHFLRKLRYAQALRTGDLAIIRLDFTRDHFQQRGFTRAIAPDQAQPLAAIDGKAHAIEQRRLAERKDNIAESQDSHSIYNQKAGRALYLT